MVACKGCGREFESRDSMEQHYAAKHAKHEPAPAPKKKSSKKMILAIAAFAVVLLGYFAFASGSDEKPVVTSGDISGVNLDEVPKGFTHRHPALTIFIKGERVPVPANMGLGGIHQSVHTHDTTGVLHFETSRPTPENSVLGYFFNSVWRRNFNSTCIFENCNGPAGNLTMTVNGQPNFQFHNYIPKDRDEIVIRFG